jgi:hypothetical protein
MPTIKLAQDDAKQAPEQGLHLTLKPTTTPAIESMEVTLYGIKADKAQVIPAGPVYSSAVAPDVSRTFEFHRAAKEQSLASVDLWMSGVGALSWAEVTSIHYADGTGWHASSTSICRAVPSAFLLVDSK